MYVCYLSSSLITLITEEIVHKINLILDGMTSEAKDDYLGGRKNART